MSGDDPTRVPVRPLLRRTGTHVTLAGQTMTGVRLLGEADEIRLTVEARTAALRAAVALAAEGKVRSDLHGVMETAARFEAWLLRE